MPLSGINISSSYSTSKTNQDSHDVTSSEANRYDQHYQTSHSGNTTTKNTTSTDDSDRSTTNTTTMIDRSYHVNIINSNFQPGLTSPLSQPAIASPETGNEREKENTKIELNVEILFSQMSPEMEESATNFIILAYIKKSDPMARAKYICDSFEKQYGKSFHCVIGSDFGNFVNYLKKCYIHVKVADQRVVIFKTPEIAAEAEIKQLQDSLEEAKISLQALETCIGLIEEYRTELDQNCYATKPVNFVNEKHGELQAVAIQKFDEWTKKNEKALTQKHRQDFIKLQTNKFFSTYDSRNRERHAFENKPDETRWIPASDGNFPHGAVIGCREHREVVIVARAWHEGHLTPGKLCAMSNHCYIGYYGKEIEIKTYEVLCHAKVNWVKVHNNGKLPSNALPGGRKPNGEIMYSGRVQHDGTTVLGKVVPSLSTCFVGYRGKEYSFKEFEILVKV